MLGWGYYKIIYVAKIMNNIKNNIWLILLAIYIISPFDAHPLFFDDLIALGVFFYLQYKNKLRKKQQQQDSDYYNNSQKSSQSDSNNQLTLDESYSVLGVSPNASMDEINKAYKSKMTKSHPDKVSHLSEELQEKAREITLRINNAIDIIKQHKKC